MSVKIFLFLLFISQFLFPSTFKVLTYNIHALHPIIAGDSPHLRIPKILNQSTEYDFIFFQENWIYDSSYLKEQLPGYNFILSNESKFIWPLNSLINSNGSGLTMAISNKYKIIQSHEELFDCCNGWLSSANDCLASKGFQHLELDIDGHKVHLYNTHLDAGNSQSDISTREKQISHIISYIENNSANCPVILSGDLNINYLDNEKKTVERLLDALDLNMINWSAENLYEKQALDYILYRGINVEENLFGVSLKLLGLSDHPPIEATFQIK